ncbi:MAG: glycosyltransferase family 4 protein [Pirellulales bacterium]|nr:glycosyltransferase family 4 protein [Pirellulales bacterium]
MKIALNIEMIGKRGGAEKYAGSLARYLAAAGHEVHVVARQVDPGELPPEVRVHRIRPARVPGLGWLRAYRFAAASERVLRGLQVDCILGFSKAWRQHAYLSVGGPHRAALDHGSQRFRSRWLRAVWRLGKLLSLKQWSFRLIDRKAFHSGRMPHVIAVSRMSAEHFRQYHGVPADRLSVVYNGLDDGNPLDDPAAAREAFRRELGLADDDVAVLFVARNYALKGLAPLLEAFAPVAASQPRAKLVVCGNDRSASYRRHARRLGIEDRVRFLGFLEDVRGCFAGCDLFAFPSFYDPCSLVVLEAMAAGLPVIATRQNGAGELLTEGADGFVLESPWAVEQMTDRIGRLVRDDELRRRMGREAAVHVQAFTLGARMQELLAIVERISSKAPPSRATRSAA